MGLRQANRGPGRRRGVEVVATLISTVGLRLHIEPGRNWVKVHCVGIAPISTMGLRRDAQRLELWIAHAHLINKATHRGTALISTVGLQLLASHEERDEVVLNSPEPRRNCLISTVGLRR